jgi:hypothetical protein
MADQNQWIPLSSRRRSSQNSLKAVGESQLVNRELLAGRGPNVETDDKASDSEDIPSRHFVLHRHVLRLRCSHALNASSRRMLDNRYDLVDLLADLSRSDRQIVLVLQIKPELRTGVERLAEPKRGIGRDAGRLRDDAFDARARDTGRLGQRAGRKVERHEELFAKNFAGMQGRERLGHGRVSYVDGSARNATIRSFM